MKDITVKEEEKKKVKKWFENDVLPVLNKYDLLDDYVPQKRNNLWIIVTIGIAIAALVTLIYLSSSGYFNSDISTNLNITPENTILNNYEFNPSTSNQYQHDIVVNIPEKFCQCKCNTNSST